MTQPQQNQQKLRETRNELFGLDDLEPESIAHVGNDAFPEIQREYRPGEGITIPAGMNLVVFDEERQVQVECEVMKECSAALSRLPLVDRGRVLTWLMNRVNEVERREFEERHKGRVPTELNLGTRTPVAGES